MTFVTPLDSLRVLADSMVCDHCLWTLAFLNDHALAF